MQSFMGNAADIDHYPPAHPGIPTVAYGSFEAWRDRTIPPPLMDIPSFVGLKPFRAIRTIAVWDVG